jgi:EAL domain-containing protein (putative c-di-GMP-specific phosphodiesterase class I)/GGDEF domain-containing protein
VIKLFDAYQTGLYKHIPDYLDDPDKSRQILEISRRLAFHALTEITDQLHTAADHEEDLDPTYFDVATGALNQDGFEAALDYQLSKMPDTTFAILMVQLDYGSHSTNALMRTLPEVARRLNQVTREGDLMARLSSRRWVLGLQQVNDGDFAFLAASNVMRQFNEDMTLAGQNTRVKSYIGIALGNAHGKDSKTLLQAASTALNWANNSIEGYKLYDPEIVAELDRIDAIAPHFTKALFDNTLQLYYQPQFSMASGHIVGLEALLRWAREDGFVPIPLMFSVIERNDLIQPFTQWLINTAFRNLAEFIEASVDTTISINLLPQNFVAPDFCDVIAQALEVWGVPPEKIVLELTEGTMLNNTEQTMDTMKKLTEMGLKLSIDDFGTGYSSLAYLSRMPIREIKIDQSFIRNMLQSKEHLAIVRTIMELANNFDMFVVAKGVETQAAAVSLAELGCDTIQGYLFSHPKSIEDLMAWQQDDPEFIWRKTIH